MKEVWKEEKENRGVALAKSKARRSGGECGQLRAHGMEVRGIPKSGDKRSLGEVGGEKGGWCRDASEGARRKVVQGRERGRREQR